MTILKNSQPIATIDDWFTLAPPKDGLSQWVDGRSAAGTLADVQDGVLYGPFTVPGAPLFDEPASLYFGKAVRRLPRDAAR